MSELDDAIDTLELRSKGPAVGIAQRSRAELAQLRADLHAAQERIAWLTTDIGESGLAAINRLIAACERSDIPQQYTPDLSIARDEILRQARQLDEAREIFENIFKRDWTNTMIHDKAHAWLAANPASQEQTP